MNSVYSWLFLIPLVIAVPWYVVSYWRYADLYKEKRGIEMWAARGEGPSVLSTEQDDPELEAGRQRLNRQKWIVSGVMIVMIIGRIAWGIIFQQ